VLVVARVYIVNGYSCAGTTPTYKQMEMLLYAHNRAGGIEIKTFINYWQIYMPMKREQYDLNGKYYLYPHRHRALSCVMYISDKPRTFKTTFSEKQDICTCLTGEQDSEDVRYYIDTGSYVAFIGTGGISKSRRSPPWITRMLIHRGFKNCVYQQEMYLNSQFSGDFGDLLIDAVDIVLYNANLNTHPCGDLDVPDEIWLDSVYNSPITPGRISSILRKWGNPDLVVKG